MNRRLSSGSGLRRAKDKILGHVHTKSRIRRRPYFVRLRMASTPFRLFFQALAGIRKNLNETAPDALTWLGGYEGNHGFPQFIPLSETVDFSQELNATILEEFQKKYDKKY